MVPILIAIAGAILIIAGAIVQYNEKEEAKKAADEANKEVKKFNTKLSETQEMLVAQQIKAAEQVDSANTEIIRLNNELSRKTSTLLDQSETTRKKQEETINFLQGSESAELSFYGKDLGLYGLVLFNNTKYPIYDLKLTTIDFDKIFTCKNVISNDAVTINEACLRKFSTSQGPYFISPGSRQLITHSIPKSNEIIHLRIETISRIKITVYFCIIQPLDRQINYCIRIYEVSDMKNKLLRQINSGIEIKDDAYWNKHFFADKILYTGSF